MIQYKYIFWKNGFEFDVLRKGI